MILRNPHIVDKYFSRRFKYFPKNIFIQIVQMRFGIGIIEYQARGTAHVHGCVCLKSDPGCTLLGKKYCMDV